MRFVVLVFVFLALNMPARAGDEAPASGVVCRWCDLPVTPDGRADEPAWRYAQVIDRFHAPGLGGKAADMTNVRLLWDREHLHLFAEGKESAHALVLFLKPSANHPGYHEFRLDAAGTFTRLFHPKKEERRKREAESSLAQLKVVKGSDGAWSAEASVPWTDLLRTGGRPEPGEAWAVLLARTATDGKVVAASAPLPQGDPHDHAAYAPLRFAGPEAATARPFGIARRVPLTTSTVVGSPDPPLPYRIRRVYPDLKLSNPIAVVHQPGSDRLLCITGDRPHGATRILRIKDEPGVKLDDAEVLLDFDYTAYDVAFHPDFAKNGYVFVGSNGPQSGPGKDKKTRVTRYTMSPAAPYTLDPKSEKLIIDWQSNGHNGGALAFGRDGRLYVTSGDGTSDSDTDVVGQDMSSLLAKVLRIDVDHPEPGNAYSVPQDNPFVAMAGARPEIWALGLRNPWRMTVDRETGHVWVGQNGQDLFEQAFLVRKGDNYGWSVYEGSAPFYLNRKLGPTPHVKPTLEHPHSEFRSLTGGVVYYGSRHPELRGAYVYGDYSTGRVWAAKHDGAKLLWHREIASTRLQITGFGTDSRGELLVVDYRPGGEGGLYALEATPKDLPPSTFPKKLSESGLFRSVKGHVVEPGLIPYSVNAPFWSDGVYKERWIALPGADATIDAKRSRGWNFPDRTVIVKSFAFETEEGNPASRRWVETRFLTKQGEWYGYSYEWNEEQTEAVLVGAAGKDREFTVKTRDGVRKQPWRYPSRAECMVCHSRAANYVLGLCEEQMNKEHDYGGVKDNQLRVLEHLGVLRVNWANEARTAVTDRAKADPADKQLADYAKRLSSAGGQRPAPVSTLLAFAPDKYRRMVDPYDDTHDLELRARSYLHSNCAQCHVEAGGGNAQMELEFKTPLDKTNVIDVPPLHHTFGLPDARLVAPGHPERSTLLYRLAHRGPGQMPPLSTRQVDTAAVEMLTEWIRRMKR